ncbi:MAG: hypothetical protein JSW41_03940 [Candidatus Aenigmatarchaeota archaeon]|nr:MAG: hypothetical protein JSW41_03940 [Candidatus Aenigmarchaeota archaeon]
MTGTVDDYYPSDWLKSEDIRENTELTVTKVEPKKVGEDTRLVMSFEEIDKSLVLNKTNANRMVEITGTKSYSEWSGEVVTLYTILTTYKKEEVKAIRIKVEDKKETEEEKDEDE